jgi:hypothetical protein
MRKTRIYLALGCCFLAMAIFAWAQSNRKPGLWEMTSNTTWQQSPMPPGMQAPAGSPFAGGPRTTQVCLTQAMIDKYGAPVPQPSGQCTVSNVSIKPTSMSADMVCTGMMNLKATMESVWTDPDVAHGKIHFIGTMQAGPNARPVEWTVESTSVYKGPDCGSVKPMTMPAEK